MRLLLLAIALALPCTVASPLGAQADPARLPHDSVVRRIIAERVDAKRNASIVVGLIDRDGPRVVAAGIGANGRPADAHTLYEIGSITKTMTAALLADMAARGEVRLDQAVTELLPAGATMPSRNGREITLADLATHTSGLPRLPSNLAPRDPANPYADYDSTRLLDFLRGYALPRDVGDRFEYSNLGVGLLGWVLARRAGKPWEELVAERVLAPLGMRSTAATLLPPLRSRLAPGHDPAGTPVRNWELDALAGAGALRSSVDDMLRYIAANLAPPATPLGRALAATHAGRAAVTGTNRSVGLAWMRAPLPSGDTVIAHNGGTAGYLSFTGFDRRRGVGVVVLTNTVNGIDDLGMHLLAGLPLAPLPVARTEITLSPEALDRFVGDYPLAPTFVMAVRRDGAVLTLQATGQPAFRIFPEAPTKFFLKVVDAQLEFETDATGAVTGVVLVQNGMRQRAPKRAVAPP